MLSILNKWRIQGGANPAMAPLEVGNGVWPPRIDVGYGFAPPPYGKNSTPTEKWHSKTLKRSMTKKGHQTFWEIDDNFFGKRLNKGR